MPLEAQRRARQAVLFVDISGSVGIYAERGDTVGFLLSSRCLTLLEAQVHGHGGRVVKQLGDAILAVHDVAEDAVRAAHDMVAAVHDPDSELGKENIRIRVGITFGNVVRDRGDVFGDTVNVASRLLGLARPDEILLTEAVFETLSAELKASARSINALPIRGRPQPVHVYRYLYSPGDDTPVRGSVSTRFGGLLDDALLELDWEGCAFAVHRDAPKLSIGRAANNHVIVEHDAVSRVHAEIGLRGDRFVLADKSTNGTYLRPENSAPTRVHREEVALFGRGQIVLGTRTGPEIAYRVVAVAVARR